MRARFRGFSFRVSAWAAGRAGFFIEWLMEDAGGEGDRSGGADLPFALSLSLLGLSSGGGNACGRFGGGALDVWRTAGRGRGGLNAAEG